MSHLLETIKIVNRKFENISFHNERMNRSRKELLNAADYISIDKVVSIPADVSNGAYKLRIEYWRSIEKIEFLPYKIRSINKLKLIEDNSIEYGYKFTDRGILNKHVQNAKEADDIIIVKNGFVTDTSYSNLLFYDGRKWVTPTSFLLNGTKRRLLLNSGIITEEEIKISDINKYSHLKLINAMIGFEESPLISTNNIIY